MVGDAWLGLGLRVQRLRVQGFKVQGCVVPAELSAHGAQ